MTHSGTALIDPYKIFAKIDLGPGMRVADLGCGRTGHFVFAASQVIGDKGIVYAVDVIKNVLESVKSMAKTEGCDNVRTVWSDIELIGKTPIPDNSLDACFFINVLSQVKDKVSALGEATRMLRRDGFLIVVDWVKKLGGLGPTPELMLPAEKLTGLGAGKNLKPIDKSMAGDYHYAVIFQKIS